MSLLPGLLPDRWTVIYVAGNQFTPFYTTNGALVSFLDFNAAKNFADSQAALSPAESAFMVLPVYYLAQGSN